MLLPCVIGGSAGCTPLFLFLFLNVGVHKCNGDPNRPNGKCGCQKPDLCIAAHKRNNSQNGGYENRNAGPDGLLLIHALHILSFCGENKKEELPRIFVDT